VQEGIHGTIASARSASFPPGATVAEYLPDYLFRFPVVLKARLFWILTVYAAKPLPQAGGDRGQCGGHRSPRRLAKAQGSPYKTVKMRALCRPECGGMNKLPLEGSAAA